MLRYALVLAALTLALMPSPATADTSLCAWQTLLATSACAGSQSFQGGDGSCSTAPSWRGTGLYAFVHVGSSTRGVFVENSCYAYDWGTPYAGSQVSVAYVEGQGSTWSTRGAYLNTGAVQGGGSYCYVTTFTHAGEDPNAPRVDCPTHFRAPVLLTLLP